MLAMSHRNTSMHICVCKVKNLQEHLALSALANELELLRIPVKQLIVVRVPVTWRQIPIASKWRLD